MKPTENDSSRAEEDCPEGLPKEQVLDRLIKRKAVELDREGERKWVEAMLRIFGSAAEHEESFDEQAILDSIPDETHREKVREIFDERRNFIQMSTLLHICHCAGAEREWNDEKWTSTLDAIFDYWEDLPYYMPDDYSDLIDVDDDIEK